jgi:hypothetical protein
MGFRQAAQVPTCSPHLTHRDAGNAGNRISPPSLVVVLAGITVSLRMDKLGCLQIH